MQVLDRGTMWMDPGCFDDAHQASQFIQAVERRQGLKIGCIEEIAWREGFIDDTQLRELAGGLLKSGYGEYLMRLTDDPRCPRPRS